MADRGATLDLDAAGGPTYLGWRGALLAELALARVPGLDVHRRPDPSYSEVPYDYLVSVRHGECFFVVVRAFSSMQLGVREPASAAEWRWEIEAELVRKARASHSPVVLFLFDADTDHGHYLRLDTLPAPGPKAMTVTLALPAEATLDRDGLARLIEQLQQRRSA